jgi:diacylglycerol O-acyltransferase
MAEPRRMDRLTAQDLLMLWPDELGWPEDIGALAILDGTSLLDRDGRVRIDAVRRHLEPRLPQVPRFRQLLYRPRHGLGWPLWVDAPTFDLADHIRVHPLAAPGDQAQLLRACEALRRRPLDTSRPLWEAWLLPGLPDHQVGLFLRAHHALADGVAGMAAFGALLDLAADAPTPVAPPWTPARVPTAGQLLRDNLRRRLQGLGRGLSSLTHPIGTGRRTRRAWLTWREYFAERAPTTSLNRPIGTNRRLAIVRSRLEVAKQVAPPTPTTPRSTTWCWRRWPAACASCWPAVASPSRASPCGRRCPSPCTTSSPGRRAATRTGGWWCRCRWGSPTRVAGLT